MVTLRTHSSAAGHFPPRVFSPLPRRVHTQHTHRAQHALGTHSASSRWALSCSQTFSQNPPLTPIPKCLFSQNGRVPAPGWLGWERAPAGSEAVRTTGMGAHTHTHTQAQTPHTCEHPCAHASPWPPALPQEPGVPRTPGLGTPAALPQPGRMAPGRWHPFSGVSALPRRGSRAQNVHRGLRHTPAPPATDRSQGSAARRESGGAG